MKRRTLAGSILLLFSTALPAASQYIDFEVDRRGWTSPEIRPSVRLSAMGGLEFTVRDENNEINASDFAGNLAGVLADRQGWTVESWGGRRNNTRDQNLDYLGTAVRQRDRFDQQIGGVDIVYRREAKQALGGTLTWIGHDARARFGDNGRVSATGYDFFLAEAFGRLTAAVGLTLRADNENVVSPDVFAIRHESKTRSGTIAVVSPVPFAGFQAAAQVAFDRVRIEGISADPSGYHDDRFDWRRPAMRYSLALTRPEETGPLALGLKLSVLDRTGREEAEIRWSDRFPSNPGGVNLAINVPIFEETENGWQTDGRVAYRLTPAVTLAGTARLLHFESDVQESPNTNFRGSRGQYGLNRDAWRLAGGVGMTLMAQRLRIGGEGSMLRIQEDVSRPRLDTSTDSRRVELRSGVEYLLPTRLALRVGYQRASDDADLNAPSTLQLSNGGTFGVGYAPRGGMIAMDAAVRLWDEKPDQPGSENRKAASQDLMMAVRVLF